MEAIISLLGGVLFNGDLRRGPRSKMLRAYTAAFREAAQADEWSSDRLTRHLKSGSVPGAYTWPPPQDLGPLFDAWSRRLAPMTVARSVLPRRSRREFFRLRTRGA